MKRFNHSNLSINHLWNNIRKICRGKNKKVPYCSKTKPVSATFGRKANDDYVEVEEEDRVSSDSISLYQCEMPAEKIKKLKAKQDSMSRLQGLPLGVKSCYPTVDKSKPKFVDYESIVKKPMLVSAEVFARSRYGASCENNNDDYLNMEDPPNFDDFMYLRWQESPPQSPRGTVDSSSGAAVGTPPPPYSDISPSFSNYINMH